MPNRGSTYLHRLPISILSTRILALPVQPGCYPDGPEDALEMFVYMHSTNRRTHLSEIRCFRSDARDDKWVAEPADCDRCRAKQRIHPRPRCAHCLQTAMYMCSACKSVHFCTRACQVEHWNEHRPICQRITQFGKGNASTHFGQFVPTDKVEDYYRHGAAPFVSSVE